MSFHSLSNLPSPLSRSNQVALLFSGGRDSSLAACLLASRGISVRLMTGRSGTETGNNLTEIRLQELTHAFPDTFSHEYLSTVGLFRRIAIEGIERDFATYKHNLILVGAKIALVSEAVIRCLPSEVRRIADGSTAYQRSFGEQRPASLRLLVEFCARFGIEFETPVSDYESEEEVKRDLCTFGITTKSLEATSIFGDSFSTPSDEAVSGYMSEKLSIAAQLIELRTGAAMQMEQREKV